MPSDFPCSLSNESGVFQTVLLGEQTNANICNTSDSVNVTSTPTVAASSLPSVALGSTSTVKVGSVPSQWECVRTSSSPLPAENSIKESTKSQVTVSATSKSDLNVSGETHSHHDDTENLSCSSPLTIEESLCEKEQEPEVLEPSDKNPSSQEKSDFCIISEQTKPQPKTTCDPNPKEEVLVIGGDLLISKVEESHKNDQSNLKPEHTGKSLFPHAYADSSLTIRKIDYKCSVLQSHSKVCLCSTPRLHVYLTDGHQCSVTCNSTKCSKNKLIKTHRPCTKPLEKHPKQHHSSTATMMTGKLKTKSQSRKKLLQEKSKDEPQSELLAEGECVWLPTIMSTLSGDVEYVVLDDDALNLGKAADRSASPESLKSKINTIYEDIDEKPIIINNSVVECVKPTKSRLLPIRRLSETNQSGGLIGNSTAATADQKEETPGDDAATSSSLAEMCTNRCPSIKDIFGDISVKEEPVEEMKQDMTIDDFSKEILKNSDKESGENLSSRPFMQKEEATSEDESEENSSGGLFAKLIKEENIVNDEDSSNGHNSDDSLGPLQIDEKYLPSPEDRNLTLVKDVMELGMPSVNIISPFKIKILLGSPKNELHPVQAEPTSEVVESSSSNILGKVLEVRNGIAAPKKVKRTVKKSVENTSVAAPLTSTPAAVNAADNIQSLTCIYCHTTCPNIQALAEHFENHQKDGLIICYFCQKSFGDKTGMKRHMRTHTGEKPYQCKICGKRFSLPGNFKKHRDIHEDKRTEPCGVCGKTFRRKEHLKYHMRTHTGEKPFRCTECGTCFTARYSLQIHMNIHLGKRPYKCTYCTKAFSDKSTMRKHVRVHTGEKPFRCQECWRCFGESGTLAAHMATHRSERPFHCGKCELRFKTSGGLRQHEKVHSGEKQFACRFCGMKFLQKYNMTMHERIHTGEKPYTCSHCQRSFRSRSCLAKHTVLHGGDDERRFGCDHCNSRFYRKAHLRRHIDMHLGIKNYECDYCQKKFSTRGTLKSHYKTFHSHGARRFPCDRCGRVFKRQVYVKTHLCSNTTIKSETGNENDQAIEAAHTAEFSNDTTDSEDFMFEVKSEPEDSVAEDIKVNDGLEESEMDYSVVGKDAPLEWEPKS